MAASIKTTLRARVAAIVPLVLTLWVPHASAFDQVLKPFFALYCNDCHADGADEGGLELGKLGTDLSDEETFAAWERIYDRVRTGEMPPPEDSEPAGDKHKEAFARILGASLTEAHVAEKGAVLRRLNRREYQNTMNNLFGTDLDLESSLPDDGRSHEFDNVGQALGLSMVHLQRYLDAADLVLDAAIERIAKKPESVKQSFSFAETKEGKDYIGKLFKQLDDGAVVFFRGGNFPTGVSRPFCTMKPGVYKFRVTGYAYRSDKPISFWLGAAGQRFGTKSVTLGYYEFSPDKLTTVEGVARLDEYYMVQIVAQGITDNNELEKVRANVYEGPGLAIKQIEIEGPIVEEFPGPGHRFVFGDLVRREIGPPAWADEPHYKPEFEIVTENPDKDVYKEIARIASVAFRRPATKPEIDDFFALYQQQIAEKATIEEAFRAAVAAIFCSPEFLYLRESPGFLDNYALASRLSYFLTRSAPDTELLSAAESGNLATDPQTLLEQTRRLLQYPNSERFVIDFTDAWLNLRDIDFTSPDRTLFPEFDEFLKHSMLEETRAFFAELIKENLPVGNLVKSDFSMLNNRLAMHYGIEGVDHADLRRVTLPKDSVRGGILTQASILKVSANGTNTSPVVRGVWVMERIVGQAPPPPPSGIAGVEPDIRGATTIRELLDKHRNLDTCRSCHTMIDPPGFALESFDPIGGWRERFRSLGEGDKVDLEVKGRTVEYRLGPKVDASGELPGGATFSGFQEFRDLLAASEDVVAKALTTKLLTFATGREMGFSDRAAIEDIVRKSRSNGHGVRDLMELVVLSPVFRRK